MGHSTKYKKIIFSILLFISIFVLILVSIRVSLLKKKVITQNREFIINKRTIFKWNFKNRILRKILGINAHKFVLGGVKNVQFYNNEISFYNIPQKTFIDMPLSWYVNADKIKRIDFFVKVMPEFNDKENFLIKINPFFAPKCKIAFGRKFFYNFSKKVKKSGKYVKISFFLEPLPNWKGIIKLIRFYPLNCRGKVFLKRIAFYTDKGHLTNFININFNNKKYNAAILNGLYKNNQYIANGDFSISILNLPNNTSKFCKCHVDYTYNYIPPTPYLLFIKSDGKILKYYPLKVNTKNLYFLSKFKGPPQGWKYLGLYLPKDKYIKKLQKLIFDNEKTITLIYLNNNAFVSNRDYFFVFLKKGNPLPTFLGKYGYELRYIDDKIPTEFKKIKIIYSLSGKRRECFKILWCKKKDKSFSQLFIPSKEFYITHPEYKDSINKLIINFKNMYGIIKINSISFSKKKISKITYEKLLEYYFENELLFEPFSDNDKFYFDGKKYIIKARRLKGSFLINNFPIHKKIQKISINYKYTGANYKVSIFSNTEVKEYSYPISKYNEPIEFKLDISGFTKLDFIKIFSSINANWYKVYLVKISGIDEKGKFISLNLEVPNRVVNFAELAEFKFYKVKDGKYLYLKDINFKGNIKINIKIEYIPNNYPYFIFVNRDGINYSNVSGIIADGKWHTFNVYPYVFTNEYPIIKWGMSFFWCDGKLEIKQIKIWEK